MLLHAHGLLHQRTHEAGAIFAGAAMNQHGIRLGVEEHLEELSRLRPHFIGQVAIHLLEDVHHVLLSAALGHQRLDLLARARFQLDGHIDATRHRRRAPGASSSLWGRADR